MSKLISKVSLKNIGLDKNELREIAKTGGQAMRIGGTVTGYELGEGDNGAWVRFKGIFKAINCVTGEEFSSGCAFVPDVVGDMVKGAFDAGQENKITAMQMAFDVFVDASEKSAVGYTFSAKNLLQKDETDPLSLLMNSLPKLAIAA